MSVLPPDRGAPFTPAEGRIDRRQLAALVRLQMTQALRRGTDPNSGLTSNPLLQIPLSLGMMGLLTAAGALRAPSLDQYLARVFASALVIVALMVTAESDDARIRRIEILLARPIAGATHLAAVAIQLFVVAALIVVPYATPPLLAAAARYRLPLLQVPLLLATLLAGALALVLVWVRILRVGIERLGADRVRRATQSAVVVVMLLLGWSALSSVVGVGAPPAPPVAVLDLLPSTWLARFWTDGWDAAANGRRLGVLGLFASSVALFVLHARSASADRLFETTSRAGPLRPPLAARLVAALGRTPGLRVLLPEPAAALAACLLTLGRREEVSRLRGFVTRLMAVGMGAWGLFADGGYVTIVMLACFVVSIALEGLAVTRQSASVGAAWAVAKAPVSGRHLVRAVQWAVMVRFMLVPLALFAALAFRQHPAGLAALLAVAAFGAARLVVAGGLLVRPTLPLEEAPGATGVVVQIVGWMFGMVGATGYGVAVALWSLLGWFGVVLVAGATLALLVASAVVQAFAARRLALREYAA